MSRYRLKIVLDDDSWNPRIESDNLGTMVCWSCRHSLGDTMPRVSPDEYMEENGISDETHVILPLYLYDHSGITMSTKPFSCPWDSGQVGFIYAKRGAEDMIDEQLERYLKGEVDTYDAYISGEVYGFVLERAVPFKKERVDGKVTEDVDWDEVDSCWGFYRDPRDGIRDHIASELYPLIDKAYSHIGEWAYSEADEAEGEA